LETYLCPEDSVKLYGSDHEFTKLVIDLKGKDPDDAFSSIPYEKVWFIIFILGHADLDRASISSTSLRNWLGKRHSINSSPIISLNGKRNL
jgi:hypothetical protein